MRDLRAPKRPLRQEPKLTALRKPVDRAAIPAQPAIAEEKPTAPVSLVEQDEQVHTAWPRRLIGAAGTALWFTCIGSAYSPAAAGDLRSTIAFLTAGWVLGTVAFLLSDTLRNWPVPARRFGSVSFAATLAAITALWGSLTFQPASHVSKEGARFRWNVSNTLKKGDDSVLTTMTNYGDSTAKASVKAGNVWWVSDHELSPTEEKEGYERALALAPPIGEGLDIPKNSGRNLSVPLPISGEQFDAVIAGTHHLYIFVVARFVDDLTPPQRTQISSSCNHFYRKLAEPMVCNEYTRSRFLEPIK